MLQGDLRKAMAIVRDALDQVQKGLMIQKQPKRFGKTLLLLRVKHETQVKW
jgi:hypothetical protein